MKFSLQRALLLLAVVALTVSGCRNENNLIPETCFDGRQNQGETAVDCGGPNCPECLPTCDDRIRNQDEMSLVSFVNPNVIGIDCGGENCPPCSTCDDGIQNAHWVIDLNLTEADLKKPDVGYGNNGFFYRLVMESGIDCGFPCEAVCEPTCTDFILNGLETGVDCGGPDCPPCPVPPNCFDGIRNGMETGIDCGSPDCPLSRQACPSPNCMDGIQNVHIELTTAIQEGFIVVVEQGIDCDNNPITACPDCPLPTCWDGIKNGTETGIDCGGNCVTLCSEIPSCHDGVMNGDETGVDCGGDCPPCPTCSDGFKNGPELNIDCVDYLIPFYLTSEDDPECALCPCPLCPSCHDGIQNPELFELFPDCGGPNCKRCQEYMTAASVGATALSNTGFLDQATFNKLLASGGITDTVFVENPVIMTPLAGANIPGVPGGQYRTIVAIQRIFVANNGTFERKIEIFIPKPDDFVMGQTFNIVPLAIQPIPNTVRLSEGWIDGPFVQNPLPTFSSVATIVAEGDPLNATMFIDYNFSNLSGGYLQGRINFVRLRNNNPVNPEDRVITNIDFGVQYNLSF